MVNTHRTRSIAVNLEAGQVNDLFLKNRARASEALAHMITPPIVASFRRQEDMLEYVQGQIQFLTNNIFSF